MAAQTPVEDIPSTIPQALQRAVDRWPHRNAIEDGAQQLDFTALSQHVLDASRALIASGVQHGDRVGIWAPNCWQWVVAGLAVHSVGAAIVPLNTRYRGAEAAFILEKSGATALFTVEGFLNTSYVSLLRQAAGGPSGDRPVETLPKLATLIVMRGDARPEGTLSWDEFIARGSHVAAEEAAQRASAVSGDDISDILFTSGTTGVPKGVMTTHAQNIRVYTAWSATVGLRDDDRYLVVNPFFHAFGYKAGWLASLLRGATVLPEPVFDVETICRRIEEDRVTVLPGPPAIFQSMLTSPSRATRDLSSLRLAVTGAASIPVVLIERMFNELKLETVLTAYGLTECCGTATMCRQGDSPETIATTSGRAIEGVELRVVDSEGLEVPRGAVGEIVVRGYNVMKGYFEEEERTREAITDDGWLLTGDIGVIDEEGNIRITDRLKDMFIVGGFNAYPAEIEGLLARHPDIEASAVIGAPDERLGEVGVAFVVLRAGASLSAEDLTAWSRENMANYKVPRRFHFVEELPRNASGKVLKFELRDRLKNEA